ncbi:hypothetical protein N7491_002994 [Penicillium cf. griseofulvum]|uniref:F-box domain-containing protein n=1 Tax=Penicillium cf. griseofulvum TaxID=2972120 RepID=A0A9W9T1X8_9EURO|nr:hypothetical protein N7472_002835 [Penicillium cf. griseofulvum]KAJ5440588.1 hypothetical protein N7491_002994 [Penicillium cf. griseofulvum]KAJ5448637.1 hypothetical protein N7445_003458 [Penicillium cf. griseofulvum]
MLSTLPAELLLSIASYLDSHTDTLRLASCCRAFYPLLLPKVFTSLDMIEYRNGQLSHLVHTLALKPSLAQEVRTLRVSHGWRPTSGVRYEQEVILSLLKSTLAPYDTLSSWEWELQIEGNNDAWTVLLLALLPNLEDLVLEVHDFSNYTLEWMVRIAEKEISGLSKLRHFTVVCSDVDGGIDSLYLISILQLPSLLSVCGHMIFDDDGSYEGYAEDQRFDAASYVPDNVRYSNVTHIHLKSSRSRRGFANLINAPKSLESFVFEYSDNLNYADDKRMYASRYYPPLQRHRETLQTLTLTDEYTNNYPGYQFNDYDYVGSFAGFSALKELWLQIPHILDWDSDVDKTLRNRFSDVLPLSLERLILDGLKEEHTTELADAFKDLFLGGKYRCPNLTYLEVKGNWMHVQQSTEESNAKPRPIPVMLKEFADFKVELELLCSAAGVGFRLRDLHVEAIIKHNALCGF